MKKNCRLLCSSVVSVILISAVLNFSVLARPGEGWGSHGESSTAEGPGENPHSPVGNPGGSDGNYNRNTAVESSGLDWWKSSYTYFDGWIKRYFKFNNDSSGHCILQADVTTNSGELDITVLDAEGKELHSYKNVATSTFDIDLGKGGEYQIRVDARKHDGGFSLRQKTPDA